MSTTLTPSSIECVRRAGIPDSLAEESLSASDGSMGIIWPDPENGRWRAKLFYGKSAKNSCGYWFRTRDQAAYWIQDRIDRRERNAARLRQDREARKAYRSGAVVGTIFYRTWGYDQTNVTWVVIDDTTGKTAMACMVDGRVTETGFMCGTSVPRRDENNQLVRRGEPMRGTFRPGGHMAFDGECYREWGGKPVCCSWYA